MRIRGKLIGIDGNNINLQDMTLSRKCFEYNIYVSLD